MQNPKDYKTTLYNLERFDLTLYLAYTKNCREINCKYIDARHPFSLNEINV
ncbi:hypothetical protein GCM10026986_14560 [Nitrincola alkalisediminis]